MPNSLDRSIQLKHSEKQINVQCILRPTIDILNSIVPHFITDCIHILHFKSHHVCLTTVDNHFNLNEYTRPLYYLHYIFLNALGPTTLIYIFIRNIIVSYSSNFLFLWNDEETKNKFHSFIRSCNLLKLCKNTATVQVGTYIINEIYQTDRKSTPFIQKGW